MVAILRVLAALVVAPILALWLAWPLFEAWVLRRLFLRYLRRKTGISHITLQHLSFRRGFTFELRGLRIANAPGEWRAPYALDMQRGCWRVRGVSGLASLPGLLRFGALEFCAGFRVKAFETVDLEGVSIHIEDGDDASDAGAVVRRGTLRKEPLNRGIGLARRRDFELEQQGRLRWWGRSPLC